MYSTVNSIIHVSIRINCNRISRSHYGELVRKFRFVLLHTPRLMNVHTSILKMEAACTLESSAASLISSRCNNRRTESTAPWKPQICKHLQRLICKPCRMVTQAGTEPGKARLKILSRIGVSLTNNCGGLDLRAGFIRRLYYNYTWLQLLTYWTPSW
jgi:hypothetical protein